MSTLRARRDLGDRLPHLAIERGERIRIRASQIHGEGDVAGDHVARRVDDHGFADRAHRVRSEFQREFFDGQHQFR